MDDPVVVKKKWQQKPRCVTWNDRLFGYKFTQPIQILDWGFIKKRRLLFSNLSSLFLNWLNYENPSKVETNVRFLVVQIVGFLCHFVIFLLLQEFWAGLWIMKSVQQLEWQEFCDVYYSTIFNSWILHLRLAWHVLILPHPHCMLFVTEQNIEILYLCWSFMKQRSYQIWLNKRTYKTEMKFWAVLGSRNCKKKNFPAAISMQFLGWFFQLFEVKK